jgi:hypothetical protein
MEDVVALLDAREVPPERGSYKRREKPQTTA